MSGKQGLKLRFERMGLLLKAMKFNSFLPLIFIDLLVPLVNFAVYRNKGASVEFTTTVFSMIHIFVPLFSCWWVVFSLRFFYDEKGSEILFVNSDRNKLTDVFILFFIMIVNVSLTFIPYYFFIEQFFLFHINVLLVCFFYLGVAYFVTTVFKSITPTVMVLVIYILANLMSPLSVTTFPFYFLSEGLMGILYCGLPLALCSLILLGVGVKLGKNNIK